jgi:hypothetical protein
MQVIKRMAKSKAKQKLEALGNWKVSYAHITYAHPLTYHYTLDQLSNPDTG